MRKSIVALSVAAALAAPGLAHAQAKPPAAPTLSEVLDASGISVTGYIDAAYSKADRDIGTTSFSTRIFDSQKNSFVLHQVGMQIAKQPKEGFGGLVNFTAGRDAMLIHSFDTTTESQFDVTQAFGQYASGPLTVIFGKFVTLQGSEVIWSPTNPNFSHSILFGAIPFTHTGVRAIYAVSDTFSLTGGINNGWDQVRDSNNGKTLELGATATPIKPLTLSGSYYTGKETVPQATPGSPDGTRNSLNLVASYNVIDPLTLGLEYLDVTQQNAPDLVNGGTKKAQYTGYAVYVSYMFMPKLKGTLRTEWFDDKDGFRYGFPAGTTSATKYEEYTFTLGYLAADSFEVRGEVRTDRASQSVFSEGANMSKTLTTYAVQVLYKF